MEQVGYQKFFNETMSLWVLPEIEQRQKKGLAPRPLILRCAQVVFYPPPFSKRIVRLNEEVQAILKVKLQSGKTVQKGDLVKITDVDSIKGIRLTESEPNAAHITMIRFGNHWFFTFDFRYNKAKASQHLTVAKEFIELAHFAFNNRYWSAFVDVCYSAIELLAKAELMLMPLKETIETRKHEVIRTKYNWFVNLGNAKIDYKTTLNELAKMKPSARYLRSPLSISNGKAKSYLEIIEDMKKYVEQRIKT